MWRILNLFTLIDLSNDYFIAKFSQKHDYEMTLLNDPWLIGDHYLHIKRWVLNFITDMVVVNFLLVWVRFSVLQVEYFIARVVKPSTKCVMH